ncbi:MAG TPA: hypothetical protein VEX37_06070 [Thermomicrobiales bacterium]|nr:hypothetical protein [Thermomicrobiales bacterium]
MDDRTRDHLWTARANRAYALAIVSDEDASTVERNWAMVAAFYAAMHAINAYVWETARLEPGNHHDRRDIMDRWPILVPICPSYDLLFDHSIRARYKPGYTANRSRLNTLANGHLVRVIAAIERALPDDE